MKKIHTLFIAMALLAGLVYTSCDNSTELPVLTEEEYPRILGNWPDGTLESATDERVLGSANVQLGTEYVLSMMFTPAEYCEGIWYLDGTEYCRGTEFRYRTFYPATHHLKLVVTTPKYQTSREAILIAK